MVKIVYLLFQNIDSITKIPMSKVKLAEKKKADYQKAESNVWPTIKIHKNIVWTKIPWPTILVYSAINCMIFCL